MRPGVPYPQTATPLTLLAYCGYVILVWWLFTHRIDRFWIDPSLRLMAGVGGGWTSHRVWRMVLVGWLVAALAVNFLVASSGGPGRSNRYFVSLERLRDDPHRVSYLASLLQHACSRRPGLAGRRREVFDLQMPIFYNTCFDDSLFEQLVRAVRPAIRAGLAAGITHVFVHWGEIARYRNSGYGFTGFVESAVFDRLVEQGILRPLAPIEDHPGRAYEAVRQ